MKNLTMDKASAIKNFDPDGVGRKGTLFGLPFTPENAEVVVIPVPWEVTVSYGEGTSHGPQTVVDASSQLDLHQEDIPKAWQLGIAMLPISEDWMQTSRKLREKASEYIEWLEAQEGHKSQKDYSGLLREINEQSEKLNHWLEDQVTNYLKQGKLPVVLGGDHSTPLGQIRAIDKHYEDFGILQIDAHADLREAYEGFTYSHASIMYNVLQETGVSRLIQVGVRDNAEMESYLRQDYHPRVFTYFDHWLKSRMYEGITWQKLCDDIIHRLPTNVYISFDIDGLDPKLCPHTGTPVPGGLEFSQTMYLIKQLVQAGKQIIGFDLVEVAPGPDRAEWDGNVGARLMYRLANLMAVSQGKLHFKK